MSKHKLWVEKYRPQTLEEYIFQDARQKSQIRRMIEEKTIPHLLLAGVQGTGKTTIAQILIREMKLDETDVLTINASDDRGIDTFRDVIKSFATSWAMGSFKIVHLEEADRLTPPAQDSLKRFMEEMSDHVRFILTCNTVSRILPPIRSRCQEFHFKAADKNDIAEYVVGILGEEHVKFNLDLVDKYVAYGYPDIRKIVNLLQQNTIDGVLQNPNLDGEGGAGDWKFGLMELIQADKWVEARLLCCENVISEEWEAVFRFLYENLHRGSKFQNKEKWEDGILTIAKHLYQHSIVADPEINAAAMFISLKQI
jgi:replication factor C small subunit